MHSPVCSAGAADRGFATTPEPSAKVAVPASAVAEQKKSWGIGARHREQLEAQKQKTPAAVVSRLSTGELTSHEDFVFIRELFTIYTVMHGPNIVASATATRPQPPVQTKVVKLASAVTGQKKSWGIGARHREQLGAQKQIEAGAVVVSGPSTGGF